MRTVAISVVISLSRLPSVVPNHAILSNHTTVHCCLQIHALHSEQSTVGAPAPLTLAHRGAPKIRARTRLGYSCRCRDPCLSVWMNSAQCQLDVASQLPPTQTSDAERCEERVGTLQVLR